MSGQFDPYHQWLCIPPEEQPPNHYRLLGLVPFESDPDIICYAADQRMKHVRTFQVGPHEAEAQRILNALSAARVCLLDATKRAKYDKTLRRAGVLELPEDHQEPLSLEQLRALHLSLTGAQAEDGNRIPEMPVRQPPEVPGNPRESVTPGEATLTLRDASTKQSERTKRETVDCRCSNGNVPESSPQRPPRHYRAVIAFLAATCACVALAAIWLTSLAQQHPSPASKSTGKPAKETTPQLPTAWPDKQKSHDNRSSELLKTVAPDTATAQNANPAELTPAEKEVDDNESRNAGEQTLPKTDERGLDPRIAPDPQKPDWTSEDYVKAIAESTDVIRRGSRKIGATIDRGIYYCRIGNYDKGIADFTDAIQVDPRNAHAYYNRGIAWILSDELDKAIADFGVALRLNPAYDLAYENRGRAYRKKGMHAEAEADYAKARQLRSR